MKQKDRNAPASLHPGLNDSISKHNVWYIVTNPIELYRKSMKKTFSHARLFRFSCGIMLTLCLLCTRGAFAQQTAISFPQKSMTLAEAFADIERQSGMKIAYNEAHVDLKRIVSTETAKGGVKLDEALELVLSGTDVTYKIHGRQILIVKRPEPVKRRYTGVVTDQRSQPIVGATVVIKGTTVGTSTGGDGAFALTAPEGATLSVSYLGFQNQELRLGTASTLKITLSEDSKKLEEVVVVGYGTLQKRDVSSAIGTYKPQEMSARQALSVDELLQGRIPGVNITSASGVPGSQNRVSIRGIGSLTAGNEPIYVIDGIPMRNSSGDTGAWSAQSVNGLADFNPDDIESIEVLKDAASAAIYGSRATNGVILITTKSGRKGKARVSVNASTSLSYLPRTDRLDMADADLYLEVMNEAVDNYNLQTGGTQARYTNPFPGKKQVKWLDMLLRTAKTYNAGVSISGGTDKLNYYISGNFKHNEGVFIGNQLDKYNFKANINGSVRKWLDVGTNITLGYTDNNRITTGYNIGTSLIPRALEQRPWDEPYKPNGEYNKGGAELMNHNPIQAINEENVFVRNYRVLGNAYLKFNIAKGLTFKTSFGGEFVHTEEHVYYTDQHNYGQSKGVLTDGRRTLTNLLTESVLNYNHEFDCKLRLDAMAGYSFQLDQASTARQTGVGFPSPSFDVNSVAAEFTDVTTGLTTYALQSYFARVNLNYLDRYVLMAAMRADGSSKFAPGKRYGYFPSFSAGWNISEEEFWPFDKTALKIRASWGSTGNQAGIGAYAYQALANGGYNYNEVNGLGLASAGNPDLQWEKANQTDVGIDLSFFNGALSLTADAFIKDTKNLLYSKPTAATTGFTNYVCNIGSMRNRGLEFTLSGTLARRGFTWRSDFNLSFIRNKLTALLDDSNVVTTDSMHALKVGKEVGSFYMVKAKGIYQYDEEVPERLYAQGVRAGDVIYEDVNGDGLIDSTNDRQFVGSANPKFTGGFNNTFTYKGFDLSIFFTFSYGNKLYELWTGGYRMGNGNWTMLKSEAEKRWVGHGTSNSTPRAIYGMTYNSTQFVNSRFLNDASYIRCRNLSFGYTFPKRWMSSVGIESLRLYVQADNLFIITPYPLLDPEVNVSLSATNMGYDFLYPSQPRTFTVGLNLKF